MAQEVEHILGKDEVTSSNLVISSTNRVSLWKPFFRGVGARLRRRHISAGHSLVTLTRRQLCSVEFCYAHSSIGTRLLDVDICSHPTVEFY